MQALTVHGLCKRYPAFALSNVSFAVEQGQIMGFIGRNGAGKTTTLKCLLNLVHPDAGEAMFFGKRFAGAELEIKREIGYVAGGVDFYGKKRLNVITGVTKRFYPTWDDAVYRDCMRRFELDEGKTPEQLSAGMRVKYNLALAMSHHARLLILDEPTSGLDPVSRDELLDIFLGLSKEGVSILFSTHITSDLERCADGITYIRRGRIAASAPLEAFCSGYACLSLTESQLTDALRPRLIGLKPAKVGYTALIARDDAGLMGLEAAQADLETIMIHMEKEDAQ
ncbi:MAG: ABC transporter ATP-binding protein [Clostridiales bacterium]|nr:ABC transporter ATP-binding protein [Clostridiales bacterium]MDO4349360.1 ABC transporter ATP-binding protein [Eubacteriales bacterium]MDY4008228.1 ABC transporter ATP-binding protein [Candidatus Limiplasma sp.]